MTGDQDRDLTARLAELEATVRGLTQELVSAEERIRQLETALEDAGVADQATKASSTEAQREPEATPEEAAEGESAEFDDIIVA